MSAVDHPDTPLRARPSTAPALRSEAESGVLSLSAGPDDTPERSALLRVPEGWDRDRPAPLAVMLHGSGGDPQQGVSLLQPVAEAAGAILLAPASVEYTWEGIIGESGRDIARIDRLLAWVFARYAVDATRLAVGGFSDGASYALSLALGNGLLFTHCIALSPGFVPENEESGRPAVFISHGTADQVLPIAPCSRRIVPALRRAGYAVEYREFRGGHEIPPQIAGDAVAWWLR